MSRVTHFLCAADGTPIAWHEHLPREPLPKGARTVVLTNGIFTTENFWRALVEGLRDRYRVVHWDYRGHGQSGTARSGDYSQQALAQDLLGVIGAATAPDGRPPLHVAFSMGVSILIELCRTRPDLVPAMVLVAGSADGPFADLLSLPLRRRIVRGMQRLTPTLPATTPLLGALLRSPVVYPFSRLTGLLRKGAPREEIEVLSHAVSRMEPKAWWKMLQGYLVQEGADVLPKVTAPTLILGAEKDVLIRTPQLEALRQGLPHARFHLLRDAGHAVLTEAGPQLLEEVASFLDQQQTA